MNLILKGNGLADESLQNKENKRVGVKIKKTMAL
jgi:hypothetical protein